MNICNNCSCYFLTAIHLQCIECEEQQIHSNQRYDIEYSTVQVRDLCMDYIIWTGLQMLKLLLNSKLFLLFCFFQCTLGHLQDLEKVGDCRAICPSFQSSKTQKSKYRISANSFLP